MCICYLWHSSIQFDGCLWGGFQKCCLVWRFIFGHGVQKPTGDASANDAFWGPQPEHNVRIWLILFHMFFYICDTRVEKRNGGVINSCQIRVPYSYSTFLQQNIPGLYKSVLYKIQLLIMSCLDTIKCWKTTANKCFLYLDILMYIG